MSSAIYPGTFDPITNGHIDIINRALKIFDKIIIAIVEDGNKKTRFTIEERKQMIKECLNNPNIEVESFSNLLADYIKTKNTNIIIRGLRAVSDFDYEFQMAVMNSKLNKDMETIFLMTDKKYFYLNSSTVKEIASKGGCIKELVPKIVAEKLK